MFGLYNMENIMYGFYALCYIVIIIFFNMKYDDLRVKAETGLNKLSSRSHLLFTLEITQKMPDESEKVGILNIVDLAGSEKVSLSI